jgi:LysM repeat protein
MITRNRISRCVLAMMVGVLSVPTDAAEDRLHQVKAGESASAVAQRYYGAYEFADLLLLYNGRTDSALRIDDTLRIPNVEIHRVDRGDSWSLIAKRYLGKVSAFPALASLNGRSADAPLHPGDELRIPVIAVHRLNRGETLGSLAELFYDDPSLAEVLASFNGIEDPRRMSVGQRIEVPIVGLRIIGPSGETLSQTSRESERALRSAGSDPDESIESRFTAELEVAATAYTAGEYADSRKLLETIRAEVDRDGTTAEQRDLHQLLTFLYVAFELADESCAAYRSLSDRSEGEVVWDPDLVSPKIREWTSRCN